MSPSIKYTTFQGTKSGKVVKVEIEKDSIGPNEVLVEILYSGVCGTDEHYRHSEMVLGHEGAGLVKDLGKDVKSLKVGDRVGVGYVRGGCGWCEPCLTGYNYFCKNDPNSYGESPNHFDTATWSSHVVVPATRLAKIPDSIPSEYAGPLMCAGQTVFLPLARTDVRAWHTVGIVGIGGLGHLAIQFAAKMGCNVVVFSGSENKRQEAMDLGASEFYTVDDLKNSRVRQDFVDHLMVTTSQLPDWDLYASVMARQSHVYPLTISFDNFSMKMMAMISKEISVHGYCASTMTQVNTMLRFAARHKIRPMIEQFPMSEAGIAEAMKKLEAGKLRYRAVLEVQT